MDFLKKFWPFSFGAKSSVGSLIVNIVIYVLVGIVVGAVVGFLIGILKDLPLMSALGGLIGTLVNLYTTAGVVFSILHYCKVIK